MELKSAKLETSISKIISNIIDLGDSFQMQTPSFIVNHFKLNAIHLPYELTIEDCVFKLPSFCDLINDNNININCSNEIILLKVLNYILIIYNT